PPALQYRARPHATASVPPGWSSTLWHGQCLQPARRIADDRPACHGLPDRLRERGAGDPRGVLPGARAQRRRAAPSAGQSGGELTVMQKKTLGFVLGVLVSVSTVVGCAPAARPDSAQATDGGAPKASGPKRMVIGIAGDLPVVNLKVIR